MVMLTNIVTVQQFEALSAVEQAELIQQQAKLVTEIKDGQGHTVYYALCGLFVEHLQVDLLEKTSEFIPFTDGPRFRRMMDHLTRTYLGSTGSPTP